jgi:hypothetical protein
VRHKLYASDAWCGDNSRSGSGSSSCQDFLNFKSPEHCRAKAAAVQNCAKCYKNIMQEEKDCKYEVQNAHVCRIDKAAGILMSAGGTGNCREAKKTEEARRPCRKL